MKSGLCSVRCMHKCERLQIFAKPSLVALRRPSCQKTPPSMISNSLNLVDKFFVMSVLKRISRKIFGMDYIPSYFTTQPWF